MSNTIRKNIRFDYFRVVYRHKDDEPGDKDRLFDLRLWIAKAHKKSLEARTFEYRQEQARLEVAGYDDEGARHWFLHFVRLRDFLIPSKAKLSDKVEQFTLEDDEYLGEEVTALYDEDTHIFMVQRNRYSLGHSGLEEYMNLLWDSVEETIFLRPIRALDTVDRAKKGDYRKLVIRFADLDTKDLNMKSNSPIKSIIETFKRYEAVNGEIVLTLGHKRNKQLHHQTVVDSIDDLVLNKGLATRVQISKKDDDSEVETIDLFEDRAHSVESFDVPRRKSLLHETIFVAMGDIYAKNKNRIMGYLK